MTLVLSMIVLAVSSHPAHSAEPVKTRISGTIQEVVFDDFKGKKAEHGFVLRDSKGRSVELKNLDAKTKGKLKTGQMATVDGTKTGATRIEVSSLTVTSEGTVSAQAVSGIRKTLVIPANFVDVSLACSTPTINNTMFGSSGSVDGLYKEMSLGSTSFQGTTINPVSINVRSTDACDPFGWAALADTAAKAAGVSLSGYNHIMYVFPSNSCGYAGIAYVPGTQAINVGYCQYGDVYAHELGHNLGLQHAANTSFSYGDYSDVMGISGVGLRGLNAPHKISMGWISTNQVTALSGSASVRLAPIVLDAASAGNPQVAKIAKSSTETYYVSYRQPISYDANMPASYQTGASVHVWTGAGETKLLQVLSDGASFADTALGLTVRQVSHDLSGVQLDVSLGGTPPPSPSPSPSPTPTVTPSPSPTVTPSPSPTVTPSPSPTPTPTVTPPPSDTTPPSVTLTSPGDGASVIRRQTIAITAQASDNVGVASVAFQVNGSTVCTDSAAPFSCSWKVSGRRGRAVQIQAIARDAAGNSATSTVSVIIQ